MTYNTATVLVLSLGIIVATICAISVKAHSQWLSYQRIQRRLAARRG